MQYYRLDGNKVYRHHNFHELTDPTKAKLLFEVPPASMELAKRDASSYLRGVVEADCRLNKKKGFKKINTKIILSNDQKKREFQLKNHCALGAVVVFDDGEGNEVSARVVSVNPWKTPDLCALELGTNEAWQLDSSEVIRFLYNPKPAKGTECTIDLGEDGGLVKVVVTGYSRDKDNPIIVKTLDDDETFWECHPKELTYE